MGCGTTLPLIDKARAGGRASRWLRVLISSANANRITVSQPSNQQVEKTTPAFAGAARVIQLLVYFESRSQADSNLASDGRSPEGTALQLNLLTLPLKPSKVL